MLYANNIAMGTYRTMSSKYSNNDVNSLSRSADSPPKVKKMANFFYFFANKMAQNRIYKYSMNLKLIVYRLLYLNLRKHVSLPCDIQDFNSSLQFRPLFWST